MDGTIQYLNTDLDLFSPTDLTALAGILKERGIYALHVESTTGHGSHATFETDVTYSEPEPNIAAMVTAIETLPEPHRSTWFGCTLREFNIGYDCGDEPWAFNQALSSELLGRIGGIGASLRLTLYPDREPIESLSEATSDEPSPS